MYSYSIRGLEVYGKESLSGCSQPNNLFTSDIYENTATLHWTGIGASKYIVEYKTIAAENWSQTTTAINSINLTSLPCGTSYLYRVQSVCNSGDTTDFSASAAFSTLSCNGNCGTLPTRWSTLDIGDVGVAGSACYANGVFELNGSGTDIWDTQDEFRFAYRTLVGDGEIIARVVDIDATDPWNKTGIMVRESLTPGSRHAFVALTSGNGVAFQERTVTDGYSNNQNTGAGIIPPYWIKLVITGTTYTAYRSSDGTTWTPVGYLVNAGFGNGVPVYAGLALTSHNNGALSTAHIDNYALGGVLPVKLLSFTASLGFNKAVLLQWITTRQSNTKSFAVERGTDNLHFRDVDTVKAVNSGRFTVTYQSTDNNPANGINYYRLRIVDIDGKFSYSPIVVIHVTNTKSPQLFPNPATGIVHIVSGTDAIKLVSVYDITGKVMARIPNTFFQNTIDVPIAVLSNRIYFVEIRTATTVYREKLLVKN